MSRRASGRQRFFLNVSGDESSVVHFEIERQGTVGARSVTTIGYDSDAHVGTPDDPLVIRIQTEAATVLIYPNPFSSLINIEGEMHGGDATRRGTTSNRVQ